MYSTCVRLQEHEVGGSPKHKHDGKRAGHKTGSRDAVSRGPSDDLAGATLSTITVFVAASFTSQRYVTGGFEEDEQNEEDHNGEQSKMTHDLRQLWS